MLHLIYILAFTVLAFLAVGNLIRSLLTLGIESQRMYPPGVNPGNSMVGNRSRRVPHPEFLDTSGNVIEEPLLVMRSMTVDDAREQLDALFEASPGNSNEPRDKET